MENAGAEAPTAYGTLNALVAGMNGKPEMGQLTGMNQSKAVATCLTILLILIVLVLSIARGHLIGSLIHTDRGTGARIGIEDLDAGSDLGIGTPRASEGAALPVRTTSISCNL